jgi:hypothetical protein
MRITQICWLVGGIVGWGQTLWLNEILHRRVKFESKDWRSQNLDPPESKCKIWVFGIYFRKRGCVKNNQSKKGVLAQKLFLDQVFFWLGTYLPRYREYSGGLEPVLPVFQPTLSHRNIYFHLFYFTLYYTSRQANDTQMFTISYLVYC